MITPSQCRAARGLLNWSQTDLATGAAVSVSTVARFELGTGSPHALIQQALARAMENAGVRFVFDNGRGAVLEEKPDAT